MNFSGRMVFRIEWLPQGKPFEYCLKNYSLFSETLIFSAPASALKTGFSLKLEKFAMMLFWENFNRSIVFFHHSVHCSLRFLFYAVFYRGIFFQNL